MKIVGAAQMSVIDKNAIKMGIPQEVLMENAATGLLDNVMKFSPESVQIFCGKGQNGGDGLALARRLFCKGVNTEIVLLCSAGDIKDAALTNYKAATALGIKVTRFGNDTKINAPVVVDAMLGTGIRGEVSGEFLVAIELINNSDAYVISADIPSGICADTGKVMGAAVKADETVTFGFIKLGLLSPLSIDFTGKITVCDISLPPVSGDSIKRSVITKDMALSAFKDISRAAHKGVRGNVLAIGGSRGMAGAVCLAGEAAMAVGAGLVRLAVPKDIEDIIMNKIVCAMCCPIDETLPDKIKNADAVVIGNGMGQNELTHNTVKAALENAEGTLVLDADALNVLTDKKEMLKACRANVIITPHIGEMSRLTGKSISYITENRVEIAEEFAKDYNLCVVLKGAYTVVALPNGLTYININGNSGMAKGGTGDVLAGMIGGIAARVKA